jgi:Tol biopolymer transport system component
LALSATWWTSDTGYIGKVFVTSADGTDLREVIDGANPGWMPDEQWLYYIGDEGKLLFAPLDGSCVIAPLSITQIESPAISPSGNEMAFVHEDNIYLLDMDRLLGPGKEKLMCPD